MPRRDGDWEGSAGGWLTERCMPGSRSVEKPSGRRVSSASESAGFALGSAGGLDAGQLAAAHLVVDDVAVDLGEQGVVAAPADTGAWVDAGAALPYEDGAGGHPLSSVALDPEPLGGRPAAAGGRLGLAVLRPARLGLGVRGLGLGAGLGSGAAGGLRLGAALLGLGGLRLATSA